MSEDFRIEKTDKPEWGVVGPGLRDYNESHGGPDKYEGLIYNLTSADGEIVGAVIGSTYWNWFYIDVLWVREDLRRKGYGSRLLETAEEEARRRGASNAFLDTFTFQAPEFYSNHGYRVFGELPDFPAGHTRLFMTKVL